MTYKLDKTYEEKVYAGVLGKIIGVFLGRPFENWSYERIMKELGPINYYVNEVLDEDSQNELHDYFINSETDNIKNAIENFGDDFDEDELRLFRIKFLSEIAN